MINRRRFLKLTAYGVGGLSIMSASKHVQATTIDTEAYCKLPTVPTRLFASSNVSVNSQRNARSLKRLNCAGFDVKNPEITSRQYLRFAGTDWQRSSDLQNIATGGIEAPKLMLAVRGGYGAMRLLPEVDWPVLGRIMKERGTILAGFSDVTAIQCALLAQGDMSSLAAPMFYSEFGKSEPDRITCQGFIDAITQPNLTLKLPQQAYNSANTTEDESKLSSAPISASTPTPTPTPTPTTTTIEGPLWGGNLSVISALSGSPYLPNPEGGIVFLEDVGEQPYRIERMLYSLYLAGGFKNQQAIVLGAFTNTGEDSYDARYNLDIVIEQLQRVTGLPIFTGIPFGHVAAKHSLPLGAHCVLSPTDQGLTLNFSGYPTIDASQVSAEGLWS